MQKLFLCVCFLRIHSVQRVINSPTQRSCLLMLDMFVQKLFLLCVCPGNVPCRCRATGPGPGLGQTVFLLYIYIYIVLVKIYNIVLVKIYNVCFIIYIVFYYSVLLYVLCWSIFIICCLCSVFLQTSIYVFKTHNV